MAWIISESEIVNVRGLPRATKPLSDLDCNPAADGFESYPLSLEKLFSLHFVSAS